LAREDGKVEISSDQKQKKYRYLGEVDVFLEGMKAIEL
jgi:hypothetical protein